MKTVHSEKIKNLISNNLITHDVSKNRPNFKIEKGMSFQPKRNLKISNLLPHRNFDILNLKIVLRYNLQKHNMDLPKYFVKMTNDIIYDEKKHIVCLFKDYLLWDECSEFLKRFYLFFETTARIPKISYYYEKYTVMSPVYFKLTCYKIMAKHIKRKKKYLEVIEEIEERLEQERLGISQKLKNDEYSRMLKTSLMENTTISNNLEISKINHPQINNVMDQSKLNLNTNFDNSFQSMTNEYLIHKHFKKLNKNTYETNSFSQIRNDQFNNTNFNNISLSLCSQFKNIISPDPNPIANADCESDSNSRADIKKCSDENLMTLRSTSKSDKKVLPKINLNSEVERHRDKNGKVNLNLHDNELMSMIAPFNTTTTQDNTSKNNNENSKVKFKKIEFNKLNLKAVTGNNVERNSIINIVPRVKIPSYPQTSRPSNKFKESAINTLNTKMDLYSNKNNREKNSNMDEKKNKPVLIDKNNLLNLMSLSNIKSKSIQTNNSNINSNEYNILKTIANKVKSANEDKNKVFPLKSSSVKDSLQSRNSNPKTNILKLKVTNPVTKTTTRLPKRIFVDNHDSIVNKFINSQSSRQGCLSTHNSLKNLKNGKNLEQNTVFTTGINTLLNSSNEIKSLKFNHKSSSNLKTLNALNPSSSIYNINLNLNLNLNLDMLNNKSKQYNSYTNSRTFEKSLTGVNTGNNVTNNNPLTERPSLLHINNPKIDKIMDKSERAMIANIKANEKHKKLSRNINVKNFILNYGSSGENKIYKPYSVKKPRNIVITDSNFIAISNKKDLNNKNRNPTLTTYNTSGNSHQNKYNRFYTNIINNNSESSVNSLSKSRKKINLFNTRNTIETLNYNTIENPMMTSYNSSGTYNNTLNEKKECKTYFRSPDDRRMKIQKSIGIKKNELRNYTESSKQRMTSRNEKEFIKIIDKIN